MAWQPQLEALARFLQGHVPFDTAFGMVIMMLILSVLFSLINRPARAAAAIESKLEDLKKNKPDQIALLWEYGLHSDNIFNDRQNFFLFFESILLGGTFAVIAATTQIHSDILRLVLVIVAFSGLLTTVSWWYIQLRQEYILDCLTEFNKRVIPVYGNVITRVRQMPYRIGSNLILVYILPLLVGVLWTAILLYV